MTRPKRKLDYKTEDELRTSLAENKRAMDDLARR